MNSLLIAAAHLIPNPVSGLHLLPLYGHHWGNPTVLTAWFINVYHPTGLPKRFTALLVSPDGVSIRFYVVRFVECQMRWTTPRPSFCSMPDANRWKHVQFLSISIT